MALTITPVAPVGASRDVHGKTRVAWFDITFDNSYPTTGEPLTAADLGFRRILILVSDMAKNAAGTLAFPVRYDYVNSKLQGYEYNGAAAGLARLQELANAFDASLFTVRVKVEGE